MIVRLPDDGATSPLWFGETLLQVRTGRIKPVFGPGIKSAIFKHPRNGRVKVTKLGCQGDQQAYKFHGGVELALHQYPSQHYADWSAELPQSASLFTVGGFGENLVTDQADEHNLCIGDVIRIGDDVLVQITQPRQPCHNLNRRFKVKDMALRSQRQNRTGWYLRVVQEGFIEAGDEMVLVERMHPKWTIAKVQQYLHHEQNNREAMTELAELPELGTEIRDIFSNRLRKIFEDQNDRLFDDNIHALDIWTDYRLINRQIETPRISSFVFEALSPVERPVKAEAGSHVRLRLHGQVMRAYSVVEGDSNRFTLGVALDRASSRGASLYLHDSVKEGQIISVGKITSSFPLAPKADHHILIAGGIGLTAFIASARELQEKGHKYDLHYLVRTKEDIAFREHLDCLGKDHVTIYDKAAGKRFDVARVLGKANDMTHVYCCGPERLMDAVARTAEDLGITKANVHFEAFEVATSGDPFTVELEDSKRTLEVGSTQTLLDVLKDAGLEIASSCEVGNCGSCRVGVKRGTILHRGVGLMEEEKVDTMLSCVSRGIGSLVLDL